MRKILVLVACLLLAGGAFGYWLIFTPGGVRWIVTEIPGLKVAAVRGSLAGRLRLSGLRWRKGSDRISADRLDLDWAPAALWRAQVRVRLLRVSDVEIHLAASSRPVLSPDVMFRRPPFWSHLLHLQIARLDLVRISSWTGQQRQFDFRQVMAEVTWNGTHLYSRRVRVLSSGWKAAGSLDLGWGKPSLRSAGTWVSSGTQVSWDADWKPGVDRTFGGPVTVRVQGRVSVTARGEARLGKRAIQLRGVHVLAPGLSTPATLGAVLAFHLRSDRYRLELQAEDIRLRRWQGVTLAGPYMVELCLDGNPHGYHGSMVLRAPRIHSRLAADVTGNESGFQVRALRGHILGGRATAGQMALAWRAGLHLAARVTVAGADPGSLMPSLQGRISGDLALQLARERAGLTGYLKLNLVSGHLWRQVFQGRAVVRFAPRVLRVDTLELRGPGLFVGASGVLQRRIEFVARASHWAGIAFGMRGPGRLSGWLARVDGHWRGRVAGQARNLRWRTYHAAVLHFSAVSTDGRSVDLVLQAQGISAIGETFDLNARARGAWSDFGCHMDIQWRNDVVHLAARVSRRVTVWTAVLYGLNTDGQSVGRWRLVAPASFSWTGGRVSVSALRLADSRGANIQLVGRWAFASQRGRGSLHLHALPLDVVWGPGHIQAKGRLDLDVAARCDGVCAVVGDASFVDAILAWHQSGRTFELPVSSWTAHVRTAPGALAIRSRLRLRGKLGTAQARLTLPLSVGIRNIWSPTGPVRGRFIFDVSSRMAVTAVQKITVEPGWRFAGRLQLAGTWAHPKWSGTAQLRDGAVFIPQTGISVTGIRADLQAEGETLVVSGFQADSGKGSVRGHGTVMFSGFVPSRYRLQLTGKEFSILDLPEVVATIAPDVTIAGDRQHVRVGGKVTADRLRILGSQFGGVRPSADVVFVKARTQSAVGPRLGVRLKIVLGADSRVIVGGLQSGLQGTLQLVLQEGRPLRLEGVLRMVNGSYVIYGKTLKFTRGLVRFDGSPDQGVLDARAVRRIPSSGSGINLQNVQVGVEITGTLSAPQVQLYSVPVMSDTDVLSYMILGYPASGLQSQNTLLAAAASQLFTATQAALFRQRLLGGVGLSSLSVSSSTTTAATGTTTGSGASSLAGTIVTLGRQLTPYLYVSIGRSLTGTGTVARLRYRLSRSVEVQTEGGTTGSGISVYYRIDLP